MFSKIEVNGPNATPLYQWLTQAQPRADGEGDIAWNFTKFLVGGDGLAIARFEPQVTPEQIAAELSSFLG